MAGPSGTSGAYLPELGELVNGERRAGAACYFFALAFALAAWSSTYSSAMFWAWATSRSQFCSTYSGGPPLSATAWATSGVFTMSIASHGHHRSHREQPMQRSRSMSQNDWSDGMSSPGIL